MIFSHHTLQEETKAPCLPKTNFTEDNEVNEGDPSLLVVVPESVPPSLPSLPSVKKHFVELVYRSFAPLIASSIAVSLLAPVPHQRPEKIKEGA
jgi:hypothetical protein